METQIVTTTETSPNPARWYTDMRTAKRLAEWVCTSWLGETDHRARMWKVLEPSAGNGSLLRPLERYIPRYQMWAVDIDSRNVEELAEQGYNTIHDDFLALEDDEIPARIDLALMRPPQEIDKAEAHVLHALRFAPRVVAIVPMTLLEGTSRFSRLWSSVNLTRLVVCSKRPKCGDKDAATCIIDITRLEKPKANLAAMDGVRVEFWR